MRLVTLALVIATAGFAATPDFNGNWKMNASKSSFGDFPAPSSMTQKVTQSENKLTVDMKMASEMGPGDSTSNYTLDSKETTNSGFGGSEVKTTAKLDGETLVIDTKGSFGDNTFTMKDKWTLAEGGKVLTIQRHFSSAMGEMDQKIVLDKQ